MRTKKTFDELADIYMKSIINEASPVVDIGSNAAGSVLNLGDTGGSLLSKGTGMLQKGLGAVTDFAKANPLGAVAAGLGAGYLGSKLLDGDDDEEGDVTVDITIDKSEATSILAALEAALNHDSNSEDAESAMKEIGDVTRLGLGAAGGSALGAQVGSAIGGPVATLAGGALGGGLGARFLGGTRK